MQQYIPCQNCGRTFPGTWRWFRCEKCGFRICIYCLDRHQGQYGRGYKCSRCPYGQMKQIEGQKG
jgi:hypothetical protein